MSVETLIGGAFQGAVILVAIAGAWFSLKGKLDRLSDDVSEIRKTTLPRIHERMDSQEGWRRQHQGMHDERDKADERERIYTDPRGTRT